MTENQYIRLEALKLAVEVAKALGGDSTEVVQVAGDYYRFMAGPVKQAELVRER